MSPSSSTTLTLDLDLTAAVTGFESARAATPAHHRLVKHYSSVLLVGPPASDDLLELVMHMFTEDEADVVQHLPPLRPRTVEQVARKCGRGVKDVRWVLEHLVGNKRIILGLGDPRKYTILPILPGTFEMTLMKPDLDGINGWHKQFSEIFERIWGTGFIRDYISVNPAFVRFLPAANVSDTLYMAWPSVRLEDILDRYDKFAIGHCQCRISTQLTGEGCGKPTENCVWIGPLADIVLDRGLMRPASKQEVIEVKRHAEDNACVTWMMNEFGDPRGNVSCSCCGCCCRAMQTVNQLSAPGLISKPHFMPQRAVDSCTGCSFCVGVCPVGAMEKSGRQVRFDATRCIGCGLCIVACTFGALELRPVERPQPPEKSWAAMVGKGVPDVFSNLFKLWVRRNVMRKSTPSPPRAPGRQP